MNRAAFERRFEDWWLPVWLEAMCVRVSRRRRPGVVAVPQAPRQLFVDLSVISRNDVGTGIQRVVRSIAMFLVDHSPPDWVVVPVAATRKRQYGLIAWSRNHTELHQAKLVVKPGDVFLGLDLALDSIHRHRRQLRGMKKRGVTAWFVVYDLLPLEKPEWFTDDLVMRYRRWFRVVAGLADGLFCISPDMAGKLRSYLMKQYGLTQRNSPAIDVFPMGWDMCHVPFGVNASDDFKSQIGRFAGQKIVLMVGTLEPRKGHAEVLAAFEKLWRASEAVNLVIAGRVGWKTEALQGALRGHPMTGKRLFWFENASDEELECLYKTCSGVLMASHAEGFGLPVIEALGYGKPVLARDIAVFHTLCSPEIDYFPAQADSDQLAGAIRAWLARIDQRVSRPGATALPTWRGAANHILKKVAEGC